MAKKIRIAPNTSAGVFATLPGSSGNLNEETNQLDDTVFGFTYGSTQPALINWSIGSNAFYKGFAGYVAKVLKQGTTTGFTLEGMTAVAGSSDKTFQIDDAQLSLWDKDVTITFFEDGVEVDAVDIASIDFLLGRVTFTTAKAEASANSMVVTGSYFPLTELGTAQAFTLTQTADTTDTTDFATAQANGGFNTMRQTLATVAIELSQFYSVAAEFHAALLARDELIIQINPDGAYTGASPTAYSIARGYFKPVTDNYEGDVGGDENESITFNLSVPQSPATLETPFTWEHGSATTLNQAIQDLLSAFLNQEEVQVQYLPNGVTTAGQGGKEGNAVVTEISLSGGVDVMNEFTVSLQGTGALALTS